MRTPNRKVWISTAYGVWKLIKRHNPPGFDYTSFRELMKILFFEENVLSNGSITNAGDISILSYSNEMSQSYDGYYNHYIEKALKQQAISFLFAIIEEEPQVEANGNLSVFTSRGVASEMNNALYYKTPIIVTTYHDWSNEFPLFDKIYVLFPEYSKIAYDEDLKYSDPMHAIRTITQDKWMEVKSFKEAGKLILFETSKEYKDHQLLRSGRSYISPTAAEGLML